MHELSVTQSILEIALRHAENANAQRITDLYLVIGQLSSIVDDSVEFYWDIIAKETIAAGANLHFKRLPIEVLCLECENRFNPNKGDYTCPQCRSSQIKIVQGEEFLLEAINIE
jgi:hydrogenase nickel incorporation protein HypA/HybF